MLLLIALGLCSACAGVRDQPKESFFVRMPGASVRVGTPAGEKGADHERARVVTVGGFELSAFLVTNAEYVEFLNSEHARRIEFDLWPENLWYDVDPLELRDDDYVVRPGAELCPASRVPWLGALEYCRWRTQQSSCYDYRLPTEWEWEYAARGAEGRTWPWGDEAPGPERGFRWVPRKWDPERQWLSCPVGSFPGNATPDGVMDMGTYHIWEWTSTHCRMEEMSGIGVIARGGPSVLRSDLSFLDKLLSNVHGPGRVWSRWCSNGSGGQLMGFRVVREAR